MSYTLTKIQVHNPSRPILFDYDKVIMFQQHYLSVYIVYQDHLLLLYSHSFNQNIIEADAHPSGILAVVLTQKAEYRMLITHQGLELLSSKPLQCIAVRFSPFGNLLAYLSKHIRYSIRITSSITQDTLMVINMESKQFVQSYQFISYSKLHIQTDKWHAVYETNIGPLPIYSQSTSGLVSLFKNEKLFTKGKQLFIHQNGNNKMVKLFQFDITLIENIENEVLVIGTGNYIELFLCQYEEIEFQARRMVFKRVWMHHFDGDVMQVKSFIEISYLMIYIGNPFSQIYTLSMQDYKTDWLALYYQKQFQNLILHCPIEETYQKDRSEIEWNAKELAQESLFYFGMKIQILKNQCQKRIKEQQLVLQQYKQMNQKRKEDFKKDFQKRMKEEQVLYEQKQNTLSIRMVQNMERTVSLNHCLQITQSRNVVREKKFRLQLKAKKTLIQNEICALLQIKEKAIAQAKQLVKRTLHKTCILKEQQKEEREEENTKIKNKFINQYVRQETKNNDQLTERMNLREITISSSRRAYDLSQINQELQRQYLIVQTQRNNSTHNMRELEQAVVDIQRELCMNNKIQTKHRRTVEFNAKQIKSLLNSVKQKELDISRLHNWQKKLTKVEDQMYNDFMMISKTSCKADITIKDIIIQKNAKKLLSHEMLNKMIDSKKKIDVAIYQLKLAVDKFTRQGILKVIDKFPCQKQECCDQKQSSLSYSRIIPDDEQPTAIEADINESKGIVEQISAVLQQNGGKIQKLFNDRNKELREEFKMYIRSCEEERHNRKSLIKYLVFIEKMMQKQQVVLDKRRSISLPQL